MTTASVDTDRPSDADSAAALDLLLTDAALGPLRRLNPGSSGLRFATHLAARPRRVAQRGRALLGEFGRIALGTSRVTPSRRDKRFGDPAWTENPLLRRTMQAYLATGETAECLVDDAELEWLDAERVGFAVGNLIDALAPSNNPVLNPTALKAMLDTGGANAVHGLRRMVSDLATPPRVPSMVEPDAFTVGEDIAATPGKVVLRTPVFELIQYEPQTTKVRQAPMLMVPPMINKYYILDLAPGRSMIEHLVANGQQVFTISWRNPDARHASWDLDTYGQAVLEALGAVERICRVERTAMLGVCAGGILASMVLAHLAHTGRQHRIAAFSLAVSVLDQERAGTTSALIDRNVARAAAAVSTARGYLDGRSLAEVFAWLRPNDLIWNYWVNNYLLGRAPKPFDILFWNSDTTRMPAGLHRDFLELATSNALVTPGQATMLGSPVDLSKVEVDAYAVAGIADHLCRWQNCYQTTQLLGGNTKFVLSTSGHIAAMVNPPGNEKASFQTADKNPADAEVWLHEARTEQGTWWTDWLNWLDERCGDWCDPPSSLGGAGLRPLESAPGTYVYDH